MKCVLGICILRKIVKENKNEKKKKNRDFFALQNVKKVYASKVETESYNLRRKV